VGEGGKRERENRLCVYFDVARTISTHIHLYTYVYKCIYIHIYIYIYIHIYKTLSSPFGSYFQRSVDGEPQVDPEHKTIDTKH